jgi:anthranilate synthase component 2
MKFVNAPANHTIWIIDNFDSFTYNLVHLLEELEQRVEVFRNNIITPQILKTKQPKALLIGPGPGHPKDSGNCPALIDTCYTHNIPLLGICLGHQAIAAYFGANITHAPQIMHGKNSLVYHPATQIFSNTPSPLSVTRYHSLIVDPSSLPQELTSLAHTKKGELMALSHKTKPIYGLQFHPESIATSHGHQLIKNFLQIIPKYAIPSCELV